MTRRIPCNCMTNLHPSCPAAVIRSPSTHTCHNLHDHDSLVYFATRPSPPVGVQAPERPRPRLASCGALGRTAWRCPRLEPADPACRSAHTYMPGEVIGQIADHLMPDGHLSVWGAVWADTPARPRAHDGPQTR